MLSFSFLKEKKITRGLNVHIFTRCCYNMRKEIWAGDKKWALFLTLIINTAVPRFLDCHIAEWLCEGFFFCCPVGLFITSSRTHENFEPFIHSFHCHSTFHNIPGVKFFVNLVNFILFLQSMFFFRITSINRIINSLGRDGVEEEGKQLWYYMCFHQNSLIIITIDGGEHL